MIVGRARDLWTIYRFQNQGVRLDLKSALLRPSSPMYLATARSLPGFGLWSGRVLTVTVREQGHSGFVQARWRSSMPALDLLFIAPALGARRGATWIWHHLLHELVRKGGERDVQRLFAHLPEHRHAEVEVMRQAGFAIYAQDRLYCLKHLPNSLNGTEILWEPHEAVDDWGLNRLYHALTPLVVQQAEGVLRRKSSNDYGGWWGSSRRGCYVLRGESVGEVRGYLRLTKGEHGHWLKLVLHPDLALSSFQLLQQALQLIADWSPLPVYCDVRDYEGFITEGLDRCGFEQVMTRVLLVRHTTASVRIKAARRVRALEASAETAPTPF
ncbi:MAG: hypothetical protein M3220_06575 [Chloroflexota bacterium]|nr:hypothetical protein [Chloroflexota bacterium]